MDAVHSEGLRFIKVIKEVFQNGSHYCITSLGSYAQEDLTYFLYVG